MAVSQSRTDAVVLSQTPETEHIVNVMIYTSPPNAKKVYGTLQAHFHFFCSVRCLPIRVRQAILAMRYAAATAAVYSSSCAAVPAGRKDGSGTREKRAQMRMTGSATPRQA